LKNSIGNEQSALAVFIRALQMQRPAAHVFTTDDAQERRKHSPLLERNLRNATLRRPRSPAPLAKRVMLSAVHLSQKSRSLQPDTDQHGVRFQIVANVVVAHRETTSHYGRAQLVNTFQRAMH